MDIDRNDFSSRAQDTLRHVDDVLGDIDPDALDVELAGDVMTLTFSDGVRFVLNSHSAARQIWLAAGTSAWHFDPPESPSGDWIAPKNGDELYATLARVVGEKIGTEVVF